MISVPPKTSCSAGGAWRLAWGVGRKREGRRGGVHIAHVECCCVGQVEGAGELRAVEGPVSNLEARPEGDGGDAGAIVEGLLQR